MKRYALAAAVLFAIQLGLVQAQGTQNDKFTELKVQNLDGQEVKLSDYKDKVVMVVNTASRCGYTSQYDGLEALYKKHKDKGFVVLGFPSNDFKGQEPGTNAEIKTFCKLSYGVTFPMFVKNPVTGEKKQPVFQFLTDKSSPALRGEVAWNFEKFLINRKGEVVARYKSKVEPQDPTISKKIEELL